MKALAQAWDNREGPAVLVTVDAAKTPNAIYVGEIRYVPGEGFIVADNYFCKTRANIKSGTKGAVLFLTKERKSFQAKGPLSIIPKAQFSRTCSPGMIRNIQAWRPCSCASRKPTAAPKNCYNRKQTR